MEIKINYFDQEFVKLFSPDDEFIDDVNELQLLDIQCQICEKNLSGYYVVYSDYGVGNINSDGEIDYRPDDVFQTKWSTLLKLKQLQEIKNNYGKIT